MGNGPVSGVPKITLSLNNMLKRLIGLSKLLYSQLQFITEKDYSVKLSRQKYKGRSP